MRGDGSIMLAKQGADRVSRYIKITCPKMMIDGYTDFVVKEERKSEHSNHRLVFVEYLVRVLQDGVNDPCLQASIGEWALVWTKDGWRKADRKICRTHAILRLVFLYAI